MITNSHDKPQPLPGEFAPKVPPSVLEATKHYPPALALWVHAQSKPTGWRFYDRGALARELGWSQYRTRKAIRVLIDAGLYVVIRERNAAGQFVTFCQFAAVALVASVGVLAASLHVTPKADKPSSRHPSHKELKKNRSKREAKPPHDPAVCARNDAGLACGACAAVKRAAQTTTTAPPLSAPVVTMADVMGTTGRECTHGAAPGRCAFCRGVTRTPVVV